MARLQRSFPLYYAGAIIVLALMVGGGTTQGLWTDHLLQVALLPSLFLGLGRLSSSRLNLAARMLVVMILALVAIQFLPISRPVPMGDFLSAGGALLSPAPQKSLETALFATSILGFFVYLARLSDRDQEHCLGFIFIGCFVNFIAGVLQLSYGQRAVESDTLPFTITAGLFANENHFSSLIYMMIPLLAYQLLARYWLPYLYFVLGFLIVGFLFAVGSRAGMGIAGTLAFLSLLWFLPPKLSRAARVGLLGCWITSIVAITFLFGFDAELENDLRVVFFKTTWKAIGDHLPFGSGLGTFTLVYPAYEARENIVHVYANHAHNDFLELFLETGLIGMVLVALFFALVFRSFSRSRFSEAAFISIMAVSLHSLVDYPLRTMALGVVFAWLAAVILSVRPFRSDSPENATAQETPGRDFPRRLSVDASGYPAGRLEPSLIERRPQRDRMASI